MRAGGVRVGVGELLAAHRALSAVDASDRDAAYFALRATLCSRHDDLAAFDAFAASAACLGNVGPPFGFAGPFGSYAPFSDASTALLTALMWLGRLEIIPVAVLLSRSYWRA